MVYIDGLEATMRTIFLLILLTLSSLSNATDMSSFDNWRKVTLTINQHPFELFVADTPARHEQGLMHVKRMPTGMGMLFAFESESPHCMWMKNTLIPLKVIFLDKNGEYLNDIDMVPHDLTSRCSEGDSKYAIELNQFDPALTSLVQP